MTPCHAPNPDRRDVRCMRDRGHSGMHVAAPLGNMLVWIEANKTRGAAKLDGDDSPVTSPSDARNTDVPQKRPSWMQRVRRWLRQRGL
jgi:hypothetical protein